jgi:hypothetical protein
VAENTQLDAGTGGDVVRSHDRAGVKTQVVALDLNPAGAETLMAGFLPVAPVAGVLTDRSGTITTGGTRQQLAPGNASRKYFLIENLSTGDLWINFGVAAVAGQPSIKIPAGAGFVMESGFVSNQAIDVLGATTAQAFAAKEGG